MINKKHFVGRKKNFDVFPIVTGFLNKKVIVQLRVMPFDFSQSAVFGSNLNLWVFQFSLALASNRKKHANDGPELPRRIPGCSRCKQSLKLLSTKTSPLVIQQRYSAGNGGG